MPWTVSLCSASGVATDCRLSNQSWIPSECLLSSISPVMGRQEGTRYFICRLGLSSLQQGWASWVRRGTFTLLEVVSFWRDPQLQVSENPSVCHHEKPSLAVGKMAGLETVTDTSRVIPHLSLTQWLSLCVCLDMMYWKSPLSIRRTAMITEWCHHRKHDRWIPCGAGVTDGGPALIKHGIIDPTRDPYRPIVGPGTTQCSACRSAIPAITKRWANVWFTLSSLSLLLSSSSTTSRELLSQFSTCSG